MTHEAVLVSPMADPVWATLIMIVVMIIILVMTGVGGYIFIRILAKVINGRRDTWARTGESLGLKVESSNAGIVKSLLGTRGDHVVKVEAYAVPRGEYSTVQFASVEVQFLEPLNFALKISKPEMLHRVISNYFEPDEAKIGFDVFDKAFSIECSHTPLLTQLLTEEMLDGQSSTLLTDLMLARKKYHRVRVTDKSVCLGVRAELNDAAAIDETITKAIYLAERFRQASCRLTPEASTSA